MGESSPDRIDLILEDWKKFRLMSLELDQKITTFVTYKLVKTLQSTCHKFALVLCFFIYVLDALVNLCILGGPCWKIFVFMNFSRLWYSINTTTGYVALFEASYEGV